MGYMYKGGALILIRAEDVAGHAAVGYNRFRVQRIYHCMQALPEVLPVQLVPDTAVCTDGNRAVFRYSIETKGIGSLIAPAHIWNYTYSIALHPIGKRSVSICIPNLHGEGHASV